MKLKIVLSVAALVAGSMMAQAQGSHSHHGGHGAHRPSGKPGGVDRSPGVRELKAAHHKMMRDMNQPYTGDPDIDFRVQMIPHHQGAIDMARVALRHARDPFTRQLAEGVIVEQQREIAEMRAWLANRGVSVSTRDDPTHIVRWNSYRTLPDTPGTLGEIRGKSWAPGSGVPRQSGH